MSGTVLSLASLTMGATFAYGAWLTVATYLPNGILP